MASSDYDWHPAPGGSTFKVESTRNLGWWILLALLVSVIAHVVLYMVLGGMDWMAGGTKPGDEPILVQNRQITIDRDKLNALLPDDNPLPEEVSKPEKLSDTEDFKWDEFELMEAAKDEVIRMAPVETPQVFTAESPQMQPVALGGPEAGSINVSTAAVLADDLKMCTMPRG